MVVSAAPSPVRSLLETSARVLASILVRPSAVGSCSDSALFYFSNIDTFLSFASDAFVCSAQLCMLCSKNIFSPQKGLSCVLVRERRSKCFIFCVFCLQKPNQNAYLSSRILNAGVAYGMKWHHDRCLTFSATRPVRSRATSWTSGSSASAAFLTAW